MIEILSCRFGILLFCFVFSKTGFLCIVLTVLELTLYTRLSSNSQRSACLYLRGAGIKGMSYHCSATFKYFISLYLRSCCLRSVFLCFPELSLSPLCLCVYVVLPSPLGSDSVCGRDSVFLSRPIFSCSCHPVSPPSLCHHLVYYGFYPLVPFSVF